MRIFRIGLAATVVLAAVSALCVMAQDDLDDLLKSLEGDSSATVTKSAEVEASEPSGEVEESAADDDSAGEVSTEEAATTEAPAVAEADEDEASPAEAPVATAVEDAEVEADEAPVAVAAEESKVDSKESEQATASSAAEPSAAEKSAEALSLLDALDAEVAETEDADLSSDGQDNEATATSVAPKKEVVLGEKDAELVANLVATEENRRRAYDQQARREINSARTAMEDGEYLSAARHYSLALRLLNDAPSSVKYRRECEQGVAEGFYRAAIEEWKLGRRSRAVKEMNKALDFRHPKARRQLEQWNAKAAEVVEQVDDEPLQRRSAAERKELRQKNLRYLRRAQQLLGTKELDRALDEVEMVLTTEPYNQDAIRLRKAIQKKRAVILKQEAETTREGMIADVDAAKRPPYAVDVREVGAVERETVKSPLGNDPERAQEQSIIDRMKKMRLPSISFKPPATIIDAVDFFRGASKDFDRPDLPLEQRGFNFVLKTPEPLVAAPVNNAVEDEDGFQLEDSAPTVATSGVPQIQMISASDISFYEALKLVCDSVNYKFKVQGPIVMVMPKSMSIDEMVTRSYPVVAGFIDRMSTASDDMREMKQAGFGVGNKRSLGHDDDGEENQERDWKEFFSMLGVEWPEGSSIMYIKTIGKLRVKNTYENLAELEKALSDMNVDTKLIEIEARFVEVSQEDLNSLGFEWILNSDYSLDVGKHLSRALNLKDGIWKSPESTTTVGSQTVSPGQPAGGGVPLEPGTAGVYTDTPTAGAAWNRWEKGYKPGKTVGMSAFGGTTDYSNGNRYLSTMSNHISGEGYSTNDQFMRMNAFIGNADLSMILHMLSQRSDTDLLSAPKVLTRPGEQAVMKVVTEYIYPTDYDVQLQSSSSNSGNNNYGGGNSAILAVVEPQSFTMREVGVILDVTPTLTDDGNLIDLALNTQVVDEPTWKNYGMRLPFTGNSNGNSQPLDPASVWATTLATLETLQYQVSSAMRNAIGDEIIASTKDSIAGSSSTITYYDAPMEQPFFHVRSIDSKVSVYPGATIVMGGLINETRKAMDDKVPFLGDLPFVGRFFRSHVEQTTKRNLLIFVTTRLVDARGREVAASVSTTKDEVVKSQEDGE